MIREIAFVGYPCANVAATREWYERHLAMKFAGAYSEDGQEQYNEAHLGSTAFALVTHEWLERPPGTGVGVAFEVEDLEQTIAALRKEGITVSDAYETPVCKMASLSDPEGNKLTLHQVTVPH